MTLGQFAEMFTLLAVQLRATDADEATIRGYYDALKDIEPEFLAMAAKEMARTAEWFPKTSEWRTKAAHIAQARRDEQAAMLRRLSSPLCVACADTGWALDAQDRAYRCDCQDLRHLEVLGRRPWPKLLPASTEGQRRIPDIRAAIKSFPSIVRKASA